MSRYPGTGPATAGSASCIQRLVNDEPEQLERLIGIGPIRWVSPLREDAYAEYSDEDFLRRIELDPVVIRLQDFWPPMAIRWDALGIAASGERVLVEAKSSIAEMYRDCGVRRPEVRAIYEESLRRTAEALSGKSGPAWMQRHFQYANRLAHGWWLNIVCGVPTRVVFACIVGDHTKRQPATAMEWEGALRELRHHLGLEALPPWAVEIIAQIEQHPRH